MIIHQAILYGENLLQESGIDQPKWNSERLLLFALHQTRSEIYSNLKQELSESEFSQFSALVKKRAKHYPLAYLEGTQEFCGEDFFVNESVLIPRPETEELIRAVLALPLKAPRILDLGSGSGIIPITLAREIPDSHTLALELSASAISVLKRNGSGMVVRANFSSLCFLPDTFDVVTANLPYVEADDYANLPAETRWEPRLALLTQSLEETYHRAIREGLRVLKPDGYMVMEFGYGQADRLKRVCEREESLKLLEIRMDQRGIPRVLVLQKIAAG
jgi:release factor glutamine methyltransferase